MSAMLVRLCKIALLATTALFFGIVVLNNVTDYGSNYAFVEGVLGMQTTFEGNRLMWRAIHSEVIYHIFYITIILWESATSVLCSWGAWKLWSARSAELSVFNKAKSIGVTGLVLGMLLWYLAFITIGGEWFVMWQSDMWNGQDAAFRMLASMGLCLLFLVHSSEDLETV